MFRGLEEKLQRRLNDRPFGEILRGSVLTFAAKIGGVLLGFVFNWIISRWYGAESLGLFALVNTFFAMALIPALLGMSVSVLRFVPEHIAVYSKASAKRLYRKMTLLVAGASLAVTVVMFFGAETVAERIFAKPELGHLLQLAALFIVFKAWGALNISAVRALKDIRGFVLLQLFNPVANIAVLLVLTCCFFDPRNPVYTLFYSSVLMLAASGFLSKKGFGRDAGAGETVEEVGYRRLAAVSYPMLLTTVMGTLMTQIDVVMIGIYRSVSEVGVYAIAMKFALLTTFVLTSVNTIAAPVFSELFAKQEPAALARVVRKSSGMIFYAVLPIVIVLTVFGRPLLGLFGPEFTAGYTAMVWLLAGQFFNSAAGSVGYLMNMTGHQKEYNYIMMTGAAVNIALNAVLIPRYGIEGAAVASAVSVVLWNSMALVFVKTRLGFYAGYLPKFVKGAV